MCSACDLHIVYYLCTTLLFSQRRTVIVYVHMYTNYMYSFTLLCYAYLILFLRIYSHQLIPPSYTYAHPPTHTYTHTHTHIRTHTHTHTRTHTHTHTQSYHTLTLVSRDSLALVTTHTERIVMEKMGKLQEHTRNQVH